MVIMFFAAGTFAQKQATTTNVFSAQNVEVQKKVKENKDFVSVNTYAKSKDLLDYAFTETVVTFTSISGTGTALGGGDDNYRAIDLSGTYDFSFDGTYYSEFGMNTNGAMNFGGTNFTAYSNDLTNTSYGPVVALCWDDMRVNDSGSDCYYQVDGSVLTLEWHGIRDFNGGTPTNMQVKLDNSDGTISIIYDNMAGLAWPSITASVGITDGTGAFWSVTPGTPATVSNSVANNTIDAPTMAGIPTGTNYTFEPPAQAVNDLSVTAITPNSIFTGNSATPIVTVTNLGIADQNNYNVSVVITDADAVTVYQELDQAFTDNITANGGTFDCVMNSEWTTPAEGTYTITATVTLAGDENNVNDVLVQACDVSTDILMGTPSDNYTITTCTGTLYDDGGETGDHSGPLHQFVTIIPETLGDMTRLEFTQFLLSGFSGNIMIYDGLDVSAPLIGTWNGSNSPGIITATNAGGALTVEFEVTSTYTYSGFAANISCYTLPANDLAASALTPSGTFYGDYAGDYPEVLVTNRGTADQATYDVNISITDASIGTSVFTETVSNPGTIAPGADLAVTMTTLWELEAGTYSLTATVTLAGDENTDNNVTTSSVTGYEWIEIVTETDGRMDGVYVPYNNLLWSITGYGALADVRYYDPVTDIWATVPDSEPSFGSNFAHSGGTYSNTVFMYGDAATVGFEGLWEYNMETNTWTTTTTIGTAPTETGIWCPAWVKDPETGYLYMTGGATVPGAGDMASVYVFDPANNEWLAPLPNFTSVRDFHASFIYTDPGTGHKMLAVIGGNDGAAMTSTQCYDFDLGVWNAENADIPALALDVWGMGYTQTDGKLWIVGGIVDGVVSNSAIYYDIETGGWEDGKLYHETPTFRTSAATLNGEVYKFGGDIGGLSPSGLASKYIVPTPVLVTFTIDDGTTPIEGASIVINGETLTTNASGIATIDLFDGDYDYSVTNAGCDTYTGTVIVLGDDVTVDISMNCPISDYTVTFTVDNGTDAIEGASIVIDGQTLTTDVDGIATIDLVDGDYDYSVTNDGCETYTGTITVVGEGVAVAVSMDCPNSINDINTNTISVYPNPSQGQFTINVNGTYVLQIVDITGKIVSVKNITDTENISINEAGVYILHLINNEETLNYKIIIK